MTILPNLSLISSRELANAKIAIHSEATVISKPVALVKPFSVGACPTVIPLKNLSLQSTTLFQVIDSGSISNLANAVISSGVNSFGSVLLIPNFSNLLNIDLVNDLFPFFSGTNLLYNGPSFWVDSWNILVSMAAANKLLAMVIAWISPVTCILNSSIGITCE